MSELSYYNTFFKTTHPPAVALSEKLAELAPAHMNRVFFTNHRPVIPIKKFMSSAWEAASTSAENECNTPGRSAIDDLDDFNCCT